MHGGVLSSAESGSVTSLQNQVPVPSFYVQSLPENCIWTQGKAEILQFARVDFEIIRKSGQSEERQRQVQRCISTDYLFILSATLPLILWRWWSLFQKSAIFISFLSFALRLPHIRRFWTVSSFAVTSICQALCSVWFALCLIFFSADFFITLLLFLCYFNYSSHLI